MNECGIEEGKDISACIIRQANFRPPVNMLTFWRRNFLILAHTVYKMWIIQEPNKLELWNKLHFEEGEKTESI